MIASLRHLPALTLWAVSLGSCMAQAAGDLDLRFSEKERSEWQTERRVPDKPSLEFGSDGLKFTSEGFDLMSREWAIGEAPFEISLDLNVTGGRTEQFSRSRGVVVTLGTARPWETGPEDTTLIFAVTQTGLILTAKKGGARIATEKRPGNWAFPGRELGGAFNSSMAGQAGQDFSVRWPTKIVRSAKIRMWASRDGSGTLRWKLFNAEGAEGPWWEAELPETVAGANFRWLTIHTGREAGDFGDLSKFSLATGQGNGPMDGTITRLQARGLQGAEPRLARSFPPAILPSKKPARSALLKPEEIRALRERFSSPAFAPYRSVVLRNVEPQALAGIKMGDPGQNEAVFGLTWALLLTGEKATYLQPLLKHVDALIGVTDLYPAESMEFPGHLRQNLFIREFWMQNMAALALAYDLTGSDLGKDRLDRIRFLLRRAMTSYHDLLDDGDWWFGGNPSNTIGVGNGCVGLIAVVLRAEQPELAARTIDRALDNIRKLFVGVSADGGCIEGAMYWNYGLGYPMLFGWALRQTTGSDEGLLASPQVKNATAYLAVNFGGDNKMVPFNDTQPWLVGWPVVAACGTEADNPLARWMADHMAATYASMTTAPEQTRSTYAVPAFLYRDREPAPDRFPGLPDLAVLESVQEGVMRSDGRELLPALVTAVKGKGRESTHHANEDQGSFVLYADGQMILLDPGYFEQTADKHSLPLIGDTSQMTLNATAAAPLTDAWHKAATASLTVDATAAYNTSQKSPPVASRARRVFVQSGDKALVILDDTVPLDGRLPVTAQYQAGVPVSCEGSSARFEGPLGAVVLDLFGPPATLSATPREFKKDWIFKRSGVRWTTLRAAYTADPDRPLVSVLRREAAVPERPEVSYAPSGVTVTIAGAPEIRFQKISGIWKAIP